MAYQYKGDLSIEQEIAAAEQEKAEILARIEERRIQLNKLRAARREVRTLVAHEHRIVTEIHKIAGTPMPIPEPVYGGHEGLRKATEEAMEHDRAKRARRSA